jgi:DNA excision repair protein ERCC-1
MSSSSNNNDNNTIKKVVNPYAKRKSASKGAEKKEDNSSSSPPHGLETTAVSAGFSFSQAFGSVEETDHFKRVLKEAPSVSVTDEAERAIQRALDQKEALAAAEVRRNKQSHSLLQPHVLSISKKQRGNGVLKFIRNVPTAFEDIVPDFVLSPTRCALFLSLKYHQLHPQYIHRRLEELQTDFSLRILLVLVDVDDNANPLLYLNTLAVTHNLTLILAWTEQEAARYLETFKTYDGKDASSIQKREQTNFFDQITDFITQCKPCNKTDAGQLMGQFSNIRSLVMASQDELGTVTGLGEVKCQNLWDALHQPFSKLAAKKRKVEKETKEREEAEVKQRVETREQQQNGGDDDYEDVDEKKVEW